MTHVTPTTNRTSAMPRKCDCMQSSYTAPFMILLQYLRQPRPKCRSTSRTFAHRGVFQGVRNSVTAHSTTLSSHIWDLKDKNENYEINCSIIDRAKEFNPDTKKCRLCIKEKYYIIFQPEGASLNDRSELYSTCRHRKKKLLANT